MTYGTAIDTSAWTQLTSSSLEIVPATSDTAVRVVEVNADKKPIAMGDSVLNIG